MYMHVSTVPTKHLSLTQCESIDNVSIEDLKAEENIYQNMAPQLSQQKNIVPV